MIREWKLKTTDLTAGEFLSIPPDLVLRIFDVSSHSIWYRLPPAYQRKEEFYKESLQWLNTVDRPKEFTLKNYIKKFFTPWKYSGICPDVGRSSQNPNRITDRNRSDPNLKHLLRVTDLTPDEFLFIPTHLVLRMFDIGYPPIWCRLPPEYRQREEFLLERVMRKRRCIISTFTDKPSIIEI